jgi:tetratricopeptide (TPR) repeat protein
MHPKIRSLCLTIALALLSLTGLSTLNSILFESSIALGQTTGTDSRETEAKSIAAEPIFELSQQTSATAAQNAEAFFNEGNRLFLQQTAESLKAAIPKFEEAARLYAAAGDRKQQALSLIGVGYIYSALGEMQQALKYYNWTLYNFEVIPSQIYSLAISG